jgi:nucleoid DNA-binding protein
MKRKNARIIVHPKTKERTEVPEKMQLCFKPCPAVKEQFYREE